MTPYLSCKEYFSNKRTRREITTAAVGIGTPIKTEGSVLVVMTLNLASRMAPNMTNKAEATMPKRPNSSPTKRYIKSVGATPKATISAKESNSTPNLEHVFVSLAMRPSNPSKMSASIINHAA